MIKKSFRIEGHATSVALEAEFWAALEKLAAPNKLSQLVAEVDAGRGGHNLASALRLRVLRELSAKA
jgi:predicted DNA-binding ribbon-helix-helix protein